MLAYPFVLGLWFSLTMIVIYHKNIWLYRYWGRCATL